MPTVEKVSGNRVGVRGIGEFEVGDRAEVSADEAAYLCDERGDFVRVDSSDSATDNESENEGAEDAEDSTDSDDNGESEHPGSEPEPPFDPSNYTLDELEAALDTGDHDDALDALEAAERADGSPRSGAIDLFEARRDGGE